MPEVIAVSKSEFARMVRVSPSCVTYWLATGRISGAALQGQERTTRIVPAVAIEQLKRTLSERQRSTINSRADLDRPRDVPFQAIAPALADAVAAAFELVASDVLRVLITSHKRIKLTN